MLNQLNTQLQKLMPVLTPISLFLGVLFQEIGGQILFLVPWLFAFMTFSSSLNMSFKDIKSFSKFPGAILFSIAFLHVIMPIWAYFLTTIILNDQLLTIGYVISVAIPTGVTSVIWVTMCRGNLPLSLSIILIDSLSSPFIVPILLKFIVKKTVAIDVVSLIIDLIWMIVVPSLLGILLNEFIKDKAKVLSQTLAPFSKLSLFCVVLINSSAVAPYFKDITWELFHVILVVILLSGSGYVLALGLGKILWKDKSIVTTLVFNGNMRNIPVGIIIATAYFPAKAAMPVVFCMLTQQALAASFSKVIEKYQQKNSSEIECPSG